MFSVNYVKPIFIFACLFTSSPEWIVLRSHSFLPYLINTKLSLTFGRMVLSSNDISCVSSGCSASLLSGSFYKLALSASSVSVSALTFCSLFPQTTFFCCHNCSSLLYFLRVFLFFYINIYTLNKKIYNQQAYIYMLWYTWDQKNIHMKYKKIHPKNNRKTKIIKTNQRKKRTKIWILNATSMVKPWLPEFIKKLCIKSFSFD